MIRRTIDFDYIQHVFDYINHSPKALSPVIIQNFMWLQKEQRIETTNKNSFKTLLKRKRCRSRKAKFCSSKV